MNVVDDYWNHNTAYHGWIASIVARRHGDLLDVGCGDGLLLQQCSPVAATLTGIDPDPAAISAATTRLAADPKTTLITGDFLTHDFGDAGFDVITFVASLHHMDTAAALAKARQLTRPGGVIAMVGLSKPTWPWLLLDILRWPVVRLSGVLHHESWPDNTAVTDPAQSLTQARALVHAALPGARFRYGMYFRYLAEWIKPE